MRHIGLRFFLFLFIILLCTSCAVAPDATPSDAPMATAEATAAPAVTPEPIPAVTVLDLSGTPGDAATLMDTLASYSTLESVDLSGWEIPFDMMDTLQQAHPDTDFIWQFELLGLPVSSTDTEIDLSNRTVEDYDTLAKAFSYLPNLTYADMCYCGVSNEDMAALRDSYPAIKFVWMIRVANWEMRTDTKAFSTGNRKTFEGGRFLGGSSVVHTEDLEPLKYCTDMIALDIGHMRHVTDISIVEYLPKLQYLIIGMCGIKDITPIGKLSDLVFLETFQNYIYDITPFLNLKNLKYLNCSTNMFTDIDVLSQLTQLDRLWIIHSRLSNAQIEDLKAALPNCSIMTHGEHSASNGWRTGNDAYVEMQRLFNLPAQDQ